MYCRTLDLESMKLMLPDDMDILERVKKLCNFLQFPDITLSKRTQLDPFLHILISEMEDSINTRNCFYLSPGDVEYTNKCTECKSSMAWKLECGLTNSSGCNFLNTIVDVQHDCHTRGQLQREISKNMVPSWTKMDSKKAFMEIFKHFLRMERKLINSTLDRQLIVPGFDRF